MADEALGDARYESQAVRDFVGIDLSGESAPDATTLLKFRHLLEKGPRNPEMHQTKKGNSPSSFRVEPSTQSRWSSSSQVGLHSMVRGMKQDDWVGIQSRAGETVLRATITERMQPGVVNTTFRFPESGTSVITTDNSDSATNGPDTR